MTQNQAEFFRGTTLPIIRETAEDREDPGRERNPLRPMLRLMLGHIGWLEQQLAEARESRDRAVEASNVDLEKRREAERRVQFPFPENPIRSSHVSWLEHELYVEPKINLP